MTYGSLFAGIGGIDRGLDRAGWTCRWQVEINPFANRVLEKHWPEVKRFADITKLTGDELEWVDLICGGFPCQDLSQAGKQVGITGARSGLWFEFARIVRHLRPRYVLAENVPGLLVRGGLDRVIGELAGCGYVGMWRSLRASQFRASHLRKRVFIVAYRENHGRRSGPDLGTEGRRRLPSRESGENGMLWSEPERRSGDVPYTENRDRGAGIHGVHRAGWREAAARSGGDRSAMAYSRDGSSWRMGDAGSQEGARLDDRPAARRHGNDMADSQRTGLEIGDGQREQLLRQDAESLAPGLPAFAPGPSDPRWAAILRARPDLAPALESPLRRMVDGIPTDLDRALKDRTKRLSALGNSVVWEIAEWIGERIIAFEKTQKEKR